MQPTTTQPTTEAEADAAFEAQAEALNQDFIASLRRIKADKARHPGWAAAQALKEPATGKRF